MLNSRRFSVLVCLTFWGLASPVMAQSAEDETLHERANELRRQGHHEEALQIFQGIYTRTREPRALARISLAEFALNRFEVAEEHMLGALAARDDSWIRHNHHDLENALQQIQSNLGRMSVEVSVPGAELWIRGQRVRSLPLREPYRTAVGVVEYEVRAPGFETFRGRVEVRAAGVAVTRPTMRRSSDSTATVATGLQVVPVAPPTPSRGGALPWVFLGLSGASLVGAAILYWGPYATAQSDYDRQCPASRCTADTLEPAMQMASRANLYANVSVGLLGAGLLGTIASLTWGLTERGGGASPVRAWVAPGLGGMSLQVGGRF